MSLKFFNITFQYFLYSHGFFIMNIVILYSVSFGILQQYKMTRNRMLPKGPTFNQSSNSALKQIDLKIFFSE